MLIAGLILALVGYGWLCYGTLFKGVVQPLSATLLWAALDGLAAWTAFDANGNWLLPAGYTAGCMAAIAVTVYKRHTQFLRSDAWIGGLVLICVAVWLGVGNLAGLIASSVAVFIAGVPAMIHYAKKPEEGVFGVWVLFSVAAIFSLLGRKSDLIEDWIFGVFALLGAGLITLIIGRKFLMSR